MTDNAQLEWPGTPGEWTVAKANVGVINVQVGRFLYTPRWTGVAEPRELEANAKAIATVPQMIAALLELQPLLMETQRFGFEEYRVRMASAVATLNAALLAAGVLP